MKNKIDQYRPALYELFGSSCIHGTLNYYYKNHDKRPVLNLLKQLLNHFGLGLESYSKYISSSGNRKLYTTYYRIIKIHENHECSNEKETDVL